MDAGIQVLVMVVIDLDDLTRWCPEAVAYMQRGGTVARLAVARPLRAFDWAARVGRLRAGAMMAEHQRPRRRPAGWRLPVPRDAFGASMDGSTGWIRHANPWPNWPPNYSRRTGDGTQLTQLGTQPKPTEAEPRSGVAPSWLTKLTTRRSREAVDVRPLPAPLPGTGTPGRRARPSSRGEARRPQSLNR